MIALRRLALIALALAASAPALADNTADEADLRFRRGVDFYRAGKFEDALSEFFQSNRLVQNVNVVQNIARCYEQLKMYDEAYRYYRDALAANAKAEDKKALNDSLARIAPRVALLQVTTHPPGAEVYVERKDLGSLGAAPKILALPPGKTTVIVALAGHRDATKTVDLAIGRTASVELGLDFIWGEVRLAGTPAAAEVRVDRTEGPAEGTVPGTLKVKPGRHILNVSAAGFLSAQVPVEVQGDQAVDAAVTLQPLPPPTGNVVVTANHEGALVRVDGKDSGFTPTVIPLSEGEHLVEVAMQDMTTFEQRVTVKQNATMQVRATLRFGGAKTTAASKVETSTDDAPASITVITRDQLRAFGYQTLTEALRGVRGFFWSYDRQYETLGVRGFSPPGDVNNRILVLFDGHAVWDMVGGASFVGHDLDSDLSGIERIEVVRGPVSALYGTGAVFGVVNVVPRKDLGDHTLEGSAGTGSLGQAGGRLTGAYRGGAGEVLLTLAGGRSSGDELFPMPVDPPVLVRDQDREVNFHGSLRARYKGFSLLADVNSRDKLLPTAASGTVLGQYGTKVRDQRAMIEARYEHVFENKGILSSRLYYDANRYQGWWQYEEGEQIDRTEGDTGGVELRYRSPAFWRMHVTVGVEVQEQFRLHMEAETEGVRGLDDTRDFTILSAYLADELRIADWLLLNASVRAEEYLGSFGLTVNPRLAVIGKFWKGGVTKLMGGKSFRAPSDYERYYNDGYYDEAGNYVFFSLKPSPDLKPENIYTAELEHAQDIGGDFKATAAGFVNQITDLLSYAADPADGILRTVNTAGTVYTWGAELELRWQPQRLAMVSASYAFQQMVLDGVDDPVEAARLRANAPAHTFSLRGMFPISAPFVVGSAEAVYNSARLDSEGNATGEFLFLNAGLSGELPGGNLRYFAGVRNLLDERPQLPAGPDVPTLTLPTWGRTFVVQLSVAY